MSATGPDPKKWTPESRAAYCASSGLSERDLDTYAEMAAAWEAIEFQAYRKPSKETTRLRDEAWARFRAKAAKWAAVIKVRRTPLFAWGSP